MSDSVLGNRGRQVTGPSRPPAINNIIIRTDRTVRLGCLESITIGRIVVVAVPGGIPFADQPPVASCSKLNDGLVFVRTLENDDRITGYESTRIPKFVVRTIEAKNRFAVERSGLQGGAVACGRLGGVSAVTRLVVPLTDGVGGVHHRGRVGRVEPKFGRQFRRGPVVGRLQARGKTENGGGED